MFNRLINIILFLVVIYFIMIHDRDNRPSDKNKKNKKNTVLPNNSKNDLNYSAPINKKSALENIQKNENPFVAKYYQEESDIPKTEEEEEILNSIIEDDYEPVIENFEDIDKFKEANKCASHLLPYVENKDDEYALELHKKLNKNLHNLLKNKKHPVDIIKCDPSRIDNWQMYKKVEERIAEKYDENDEPKTINQIYNESIIDFKKINPKFNKDEQERIQGKFNYETNIGSSFSFFNKDKETCEFNSNEGQFECHSNL